MRSVSCTLTGLVLCLLAAAVPLKAGDDKFEFENITDRDWAVQTDESLGIFDAVVLFEKWIADERKVTSDGSVYSLYRRIRILKESGRSFADIELPILDADQIIEDIKGHTVLRDGTVIELKKDHIFEQTVAKFGRDKVKQTRLSLPGLTDDCIIEYIVRIRIKFFANEWVIQDKIPVLFAQKRWYFAKFDLPTFAIGYSVRELAAHLFPNYLWQNCGRDVSATVFPDRNKPEGLLMEANNIPPFKEEPYSLPGDYLRARTLTYYSTNEGHQQYWVNRSDTVAKYLNEYAKKDKRLKELIPQFDTIADTLARIDAVYNWCQTNLTNLSYQDLYDNKGTDKEKKRTPKDIDNVDDVLKNGYGWSSDINKTFWALLRLMGFDAYIVYYKDRSEDFFVPNAKFWQFDLSVVAVKFPGADYVFYHPGNPCLPSRVLPWYAEGTDGLMPGAEVPIFGFPFSEHSASQTDRVFELSVSEDQEVIGSMTSRSTGHDAYRLRRKLYDISDADRVKKLKEYYEGELTAATPDSLAWSGLENLNDTVRVTARLGFPDLDLQGKRIMLKPLDYASTFKNPFLATERKNAILFNYAGTVAETVRLTMPDGYAVEALPADSTFKNGAGICSVSFSQEGDQLVTTRTFTLGYPFWKVDYYPTVRELFQARQEMSDRLLVLQRAETSSAQN